MKILLISLAVLIVIGGVIWAVYYFNSDAYKIKNAESFWNKTVSDAIKQKDSSICEKMDDEKLRNYFSPRFACYINVARSLKDSSICEQSNEPNTCYVEIVSELKDKSICEKIINLDIKLDIKSECYDRLARATLDESFCNLITSNYLKMEGFDLVDNCLLDIAIKKKDKSICEKINDTFFKKTCLSNFN